MPKPIPGQWYFGIVSTIARCTFAGTEDFYIIGNCNHPAPALGGAMVNHRSIAGWLTCYQAKRQRKPKATDNRRGMEGNKQ